MMSRTGNRNKDAAESRHVVGPYPRGCEDPANYLKPPSKQYHVERLPGQPSNKPRYRSNPSRHNTIQRTRRQPKDEDETHNMSIQEATIEEVSTRELQQGVPSTDDTVP